MAQTIQYLYEYENGKPIRSLGFVKIDKQMDKTILQIQGKQLDEVTGIRLQREDGSQYIATWQPNEELPMQTTPSQEPPMLRPAEQPPAQQMPTTPQEPPQRMMPRETTPQPQFPQEETEEVSAYIPPITTHYEKIQRQDLSRLPRKEWRLANNSFLLHGFYNYHHLLYIEDGDKVWIGVPGIYHEKERAAANAFGFPEFRRLTDMELELSDEEKNTYEDFGYWCRQVERSSV